MASPAVSHSHGGQHQQQQPVAAGSMHMMARVDRLDLVVGYLEELRHSGSGRSSTTATSTLSSSSPTTPRARPHGCRPAEELLREAKAKGSLVERIAFLEDRVLRMEEERMEMSSSMETADQTTPTSSGRRTMRMMMNGSGGAGAEPGSGGSGRKGKKGLKSLVKSCVRGGAKLKTKE